MNRSELKYFIVYCIVFFLIPIVIVFVAVSIDTARAQDTPYQQWEYAALAYDGNTAFAFTPDLAVNNEINKVFDSMVGDELNAVIALNVMGERGWEYVDYQPGATVIYMFKREKNQE